MSRSVVRQLILKDLYLDALDGRRAIAAGGAGALAVMPLERGVGLCLERSSLICTLVILNIFLVMSGIVQERKDKVQLFFLSLPVSTAQYTMAKMIANAIAFVVPWAVLTDCHAGRDRRRLPIPNGIMPFWIVVLVYLLAYYCVLLSVAVVSDSTGWHATTITVGNISVNFLIPFLLVARASVAEHRTGPVAVWTPDIMAIIAIELGVGVAALCSGGLRQVARQLILCKELVMSHSDRLHSLDAVRAFALLLGVVFHAGFSFLPGLIPGIWAMTDNSPSSSIAVLLFTSHIFRMSLFFVVAGFFARMLFQQRRLRAASGPTG